MEEKRITLWNGEARLILGDNGSEGTSVVLIEGGDFSFLTKSLGLFVSNFSKKANLIDVDNRIVLVENVQDVEVFGNGNILYSDAERQFYLLRRGREPENIGNAYADKMFFFGNMTLRYRKCDKLSGNVGLEFVWCRTADLNEFNNRQLICKNMDNAYTVLRVVDEKIKCMDFSQASLIYCRVKGEEFVLHFRPNQGSFERIELKRPCMRRRCNKVFANENFLVKNAKSYGIFMAPISLGERLYDAYEYIAEICDKLYIKLRNSSK